MLTHGLETRILVTLNYVNGLCNTMYNNLQRKKCSSTEERSSPFVVVSSVSLGVIKTVDFYLCFEQCSVGVRFEAEYNFVVMSGM